jgi:hypothetical protein
MFKTPVLCFGALPKSAHGDHPPHAPHERRRAGRRVGATVLARPGLTRQRWPTVLARLWGSGPAEGEGDRGEQRA